MKDIEHQQFFFEIVTVWWHEIECNVYNNLFGWKSGIL